jgi:DNA-binding transcriptional LysR family regulator
MNRTSLIAWMNILEIDLNLLRLFDVVYRTRNVGRAAELLGFSQPTASQGLTRLRLLIKDPLFVRSLGGVTPTPKADRLAQAVRSALEILEEALNAEALFHPRDSDKTYRLYMSDIAESMLLPPLIRATRSQAPNVKIQTFPIAGAEIVSSLDSGRVDFAFGYRTVADTQNMDLIQDRYIVLIRSGHSFLRCDYSKHSKEAFMKELRKLEFVAVRTHDRTLRLLERLDLQDRVRLTTEHFLALPEIVSSTELAVIMPRNLARNFVAAGGTAIVDLPISDCDFTVSLHWSKRFQSDASNIWMRHLLLELFRER